MRKPIILLAILLLAILAAMAAKGLPEQPPPLRAHNAAGEFDARRAKARLAFVLGDQRPHAADTAASDAARSRLVQQLRQIGVDPIVRDQLACNELYKGRGVSCARVRNVIGVLGPKAGRALLLNAHYDSVPVGPGASDDGIGVATLLETAAVLKGHRLERPMILLFNEGEELGLIGARAFLSDPLAKNVGALINLEARGVRGPVNMFETSRPNAGPIAIYGLVKNPVANSLSTDVYRLLPNYTDVNSFSERRWLTFNLAPIGNETRYHSAGDDVQSLDLATLQHMGDQTLSLSQALARKSWPTGGGDRIFMDLAGRSLVSLPLDLGAALLAGLLIVFGWIALHRGGLSQGALALAGAMLSGTIAAWLILEIVGFARPGMFWRAHQIWTSLAIDATMILAVVVALETVAGGLDRQKLRPVFWFIVLAIGGAIGLIAPGGIIFFVFPPLVVLAGIVCGRWWRPAETACSIVAILILFGTWGIMLGLLEELLDNGPMWAFAPLGSFLILPALIEAKPLMDAARLRRAGGAAGVLALAAWTAVLSVPAYSADRQQRFVIQYVADKSRNTSFWSVLNDGAPLPAGFQGKWVKGLLPFSDRTRWLARAQGDPTVKSPAIQLLSAETSGNERTLRLRLVANGNDHVELIAPPDARILSAGTQDFVRPIDQNEAGRYSIGCYGRSCDGAMIELTIGKPGPVDFLVLGGKSALPHSAQALLSIRPRFARPQYLIDEAISFSHVNL